MRPIDTHFTLRGFEMQQVKRHDNVAIYSQSRDGHPLAWEVVVIRIAPAANICGNEYPEREIYPNDEAWGKRGWTCLTLEEAERRFEDVINAHPDATVTRK